MPHAEPLRSRRTVSALRIQFFELNRVGRASAYGISIDEPVPAIGELSIEPKLREHEGLEIMNGRLAVITV